MLVFVFDYTPWKSEQRAIASDLSMEAEFTYNNDNDQDNSKKTEIVYSKEFAQRFNLPIEKSLELPDYILAIRTYIVENKIGRFNKIQFYIDPKMSLQLPDQIDSTITRENAYNGFLGFSHPHKIKSSDSELKNNEFNDNHTPILNWQLLSIDKQNMAGSNITIDRYSKEIIPNMTLIETNMGISPPTHIYIYNGESPPNIESVNLLLHQLISGKKIKKEDDFLEIKVPDKLRNFLLENCYIGERCF